MSTPISTRRLSSTKGAVYMRTKYLTDDQYADRVLAADIARKRRARGAEVIGSLVQASRIRNIRGSLSRRIAFHVSKGRDAADIAIRESVPVSVVVGLMKGQE